MKVWLLPWFKVIAIIVITWIAAKFLNNIVDKFIKRLSSAKALLNVMKQFVNLAIWSIGIITALSSLNIDVSALIAGLGLTGFALGFACKDLLSNALSGLIIMLYSPFKIGCKVQVKSHSGVVKDIDFRYTTLLEGNIKILIPNSIMLNEVILLDGDS